MRTSTLLLSIICATTLGACASATQTDHPRDPDDLSGFLARGPNDDFSVGGAQDLSASSDLSAAQDLAASLPDQAVPHDLSVKPPDFSVKPPDFSVKPPDLSQPPPPPPDMAQPGCGNVTAAGTCDGNTRRYCSGNTVHTETCSGGKSCTTQSGNAICDYVPYTPCNGVSRPGFCYQNAMVWCDVDGTLRVVSCGSWTCHNVAGSTECS